MLSTTFSPFQNQSNANQLRQPRAIVLVNGIQVLWTDIEIQTTTFYTADSYTVTLPLNQQSPTINFNFWSSEVMMQISIYVGFPQNPNAYNTGDLDLLITGNVDMMDVDPLTATVMLSGRDLTSLLIDTKTTNKFANQSASQIATALAQKHKLNPIVTATSGNSGTLYNNVQTTMTRETTEWDLLTFLAQQSGFVTYVSGNNLYFVPYPTPAPDTAYILQYQPPLGLNQSPTFNGMSLQLKRSLTLSRDIKVVVRVPSGAQNGGAFTVTAQATRRTRPYLSNVSTSVAPQQTYSFVRAGLTRQQATQYAQQLLKNITIHEVVLTASLPGDNLLRKDSIVQLRGTSTSFDQYYYTDVVYRRLSYIYGYSMTITAKNSSVDTQVLV